MKILDKKSNYTDIDYKTINNIKSLTLDILNNNEFDFSNYNFSCSYLIYLLYTKFLSYDVNDNKWINKDKLITTLDVKSLIKSMKFMCNLIPIEILKDKNKLSSPKSLSYAIGNALKEQYLNKKYLISKKKSLVSFNTYFLCDSNDLNSSESYEGILYASENKLDKLIVLCMTNSLDKKLFDLFKINNWDVSKSSYNNLDTLENCINKAKKLGKPSIIFIETEKEDIKMLSEESIKTMKDKLDVRDIPFTIYDETKSHVESLISKNSKTVNDWYKKFDKYKDKFIENEILIDNENKISYAIQKINNSFILNMIKDDFLNKYIKNSDKCVNFVNYKNLIGEISLSIDDEVISIFNIKELDYILEDIKKSAIINKHNLYIIQDVDIEDDYFDKSFMMLSNLRNIPNLTIYRCADEKEFVGSYLSYLKHDTPAVIVIRDIDLKEHSKTKIDEVDKGAYLIKKETKPKGVIIATGPEISVALDVHKKLKSIGILVNVVSMPSIERFKEQDIKYKQKILPDMPKAVIEFLSPNSWYILGFNDKQICGITKYKESCGKEALDKYYKITVDDIYNKVKKLFN